jgi:hypothetical protein
MLKLLLKRPLLLALLGVLPIIACSDDTISPNEICKPETSSVTPMIEVSESEVVFDWEPACAVGLLIVEAEGGDVWLISTSENTDSPQQANMILPPVTYGQAPNDATVIHSPQTLVPGQTYIWGLWRIMPPETLVNCSRTFDNACLLTVHEFTR